MKLELSTDKSNDIIINIYPTMKCNLNCSYCYSENYNISFSKKEFINIIKKINNSIYKNIFVNFLGGEPSLFKYLYLIKLFNKNILINITTNAQKPNKILELNKFNLNLEIEISLHHEYFNKPNYFDNILKIINLSKYKIIIIINLSKKIIPYLSLIKEKFYNYKNKIYFSLNCLTGINYEDCNFSKYLNYFKEFKIENNLSKYYINKKEISFEKFSKIYNSKNFKNKICYHNSFDIYKEKNIKIKPTCSCLKYSENMNNLKKFKIIKGFCSCEKCQINCFDDSKKIL